MPGVQPIFCRCRAPRQGQDREAGGTDRKSTRLNSSHGYISYAVFCLKKKTRQLSTMISAGIPLLESLEILEEQASDPGFKLVLDKIIERVRAGSDFSTALSEHSRLFSKIYVNMIQAGESSGQLDVILQRLADYMESVEELKREIKAAMTYPVISLVLILSITVGLLVGIVPKFQAIFEQLGSKELPVPTQILLTISNA